MLHGFERKLSRNKRLSVCFIESYLSSCDNNFFLMATTFRKHTQFQTSDSVGLVFFTQIVVKWHCDIRRVDDRNLEVAGLVSIIQSSLSKCANFR